MLRAVIFDFDMTLADSTQGIIKCANHALSAIGAAVADPQAIRKTIGLPLHRAFDSFHPSPNALLRSEFIRCFVEHADQHMAAMTTLFPESIPQIDMLRSTGCSTAIVSTKFRYRIEEILAGNAVVGRFDTIVGGEDVSEHKPDPAGILAALQRLKIRAAQALYVGDHPVDQEAARRAEVPFLAVMTGSSSAADFDQSGGLRMIASIAELGDAIGRMDADRLWSRP